MRVGGRWDLILGYALYWGMHGEFINGFTQVNLSYQFKPWFQNRQCTFDSHMATENIYNMNETGLFCCVQPNKTLSARKVCGCKIQKDSLTLALVVTRHTVTSSNLWLFTNLYTQDALEGGCQHIMRGGLRMKWLG